MSSTDSDLRITAIEAIPYRIPYVKPLKFASGQVTHADHVLVRVHTAGGLVGHADAPPRPFTYGETQAGIVAVIDSVFAPALVGLDAADRERAKQRMHHTIGNPAAKSAIDMAVWDVLGQAWRVSVSRALGGYCL
jgi:L-alanine-DL-glutamate epimerase-like enolase superfamily enzyme